MKREKIIIVGAGPGGLTAAMILARRGFRVVVCEKRDRVGGRNEGFSLGPYRFDTGPTFLMMKFLLDEMFREAGRDARDYLEFTRLEPMYKLQFADRYLLPNTDADAMRAEIRRAFPGEEKGLDRFLQRESKRYRLMYPCLQKDYSTLASMVHPDLLRALPHLSLGRSLYDVLGDYFRSEELKLCLTFQSKYLGMSPWSCPGLFAMIPYVEHAFGVYHVQGGLSKISEAMAKAVGELGGEIRLKTPVARLALRGRKVTGVEFEDGHTEEADAVVINADFAHAMTHLVPPGALRKYTPGNLERRDYSCSTFMGISLPSTPSGPAPVT
jgi:phytoene desaturase